jgi:hypothetical protein
MAKVMAFGDQHGNTYQTSYWSLQFFAFDKGARTARLLLYGYKDAAARAAGKQPIGQKEYVVSGTDFDNLFAAQKQANPKPLLRALYEDVINVRKDVPDPAAPNDSARNRSFFDNATEVVED